MEDDCLTPEASLIIKYKGVYPFKAYLVTKKFMRELWQVEAKDYWEREFRWSGQNDPAGFICGSYVAKPLDRFSEVIAEVWMQGSQPKDLTKEGQVEIRINGVLKTKFGGNGFFQDYRNPFVRTFYWFYNWYFYQHRRREHLEFWCKGKMHELKRRYLEVLNMTPPKPV